MSQRSPKGGKARRGREKGCGKLSEFTIRTAVERGKRSDGSRGTHVYTRGLRRTDGADGARSRVLTPQPSRTVLPWSPILVSGPSLGRSGGVEDEVQRTGPIGFKSRVDPSVPLDEQNSDICYQPSPQRSKTLEGTSRFQTLFHPPVGKFYAQPSLSVEG